MPPAAVQVFNAFSNTSLHGSLLIMRSCFTNLISFYDKVTQLVEQGKSVDVPFLKFYFSKAFGIISYSPLLNKMSRSWLDKSIITWMSNWLKGWAQRFVGDQVTPG